MWYLIAEISVYLVSGWVLGVFSGWFFRGASGQKDVEDLHAYWTGRVKSIEHQFTGAREELKLASHRRETLEETLKEKVTALERVAGHLGEAEKTKAELHIRLGRVVMERDDLLRRLESGEGQPPSSDVTQLRELLEQREGDLAAAVRRAEQLEPLIGRIEELKGSLAQLAPLRNELASALSQITELERAIRERQSEILARDEEIGRLRHRVRELEDTFPPTQVASNGNGHPHVQHAAGENGASGGGDRDDLKQIRGIGHVIERSLNEIGIYKFEQIAGWTPQDVEQLDGFQARIRRDEWVAQARKLAGKEN